MSQELKPCWDSALALLTPEECNGILKWFEPCEWREAGTYNEKYDNSTDHKYRKGRVKFFKQSKDMDWNHSHIPGPNMFPGHSKLQGFIEHFASKQNINIDKDNIDWQLAEYKEGDHFKTHRDVHPDTRTFNAKVIRKVSVTVQLTDPDEYEGGVLRLPIDSDMIQHAPKAIGDVTIFPSWYSHGVTKITKGTRYALVGWQQGPFYR